MVALVDTEKVRRMCGQYVRDNNTSLEALASEMELTRPGLWKKLTDRSQLTLPEGFFLADKLCCDVNDFRIR